MLIAVCSIVVLVFVTVAVVVVKQYRSARCGLYIAWNVNYHDISEAVWLQK